MNNPGIKWVAVLVAAALIGVIAVIAIVSGTDKAQSSADEPAAAATVEMTNSPAQTDDESQQAQTTQDPAQDELYEGALAGLTEEEIGKLAMQEEQSTERTDDSAAEIPLD